MTRRIEELDKNIENTQSESIQIHFLVIIYYSVSLDESICDIAQLVNFIRGIDKTFNVTEEMATLFLVKSTTKGLEFSMLCLHLLRNLN